MRIFLALLVGLAAWAQVAVPTLEKRVTDLTGTLKPEQVASLEQMLQSFQQRKGAEIVVLGVPTTQPESIEQYALRVAEQWRIGRKNVDDGVVVVFARDDRAGRIEVAYGLEGVLTDATASRIGHEIIAPRFREGDYFGGIAAGLDRLMRVIDGEALPPPRPAPQVESDTFQMLPALLAIAFVAGAILRRLFGRVIGSLATAGAVGTLAWLLVGVFSFAVLAAIISFFFTLLGVGGAGGRYYGRFPGGGGFGGGLGGGGGFKGGGGSFGGGGASFRW